MNETPCGCGWDSWDNHTSQHKHKQNVCVQRPNYFNNKWQQVVKDIWQKTASPPQTDGSIVFARLRQMCPPMWAHWRHLANMIELVLPSAHPSPQPKRQIDRFICFCIAHGRKSLYFTMGDPFPQNCPFPWGSEPPSNSWFPWPIRAHNPKGILTSSAVFAQMTAECPYTLQWDAPPLQNRPFP